jgi:hypothetical protein
MHPSSNTASRPEQLDQVSPRSTFLLPDGQGSPNNNSDKGWAVTDLDTLFRAQLDEVPYVRCESYVRGCDTRREISSGSLLR